MKKNHNKNHHKHKPIHHTTPHQEHHHQPPKKEHKTTDHSKYSTDTESGKHPEDIHDHHKIDDSEFEIPLRPNVKIFPAVFNSTYGLEFEIPLSKSISLGLNGMYYFARQDNVQKIKSNRADLTNGFRGELALRYFRSQKGPSGIFFQIYGGYNTIMYSNGLTRPYSLMLRRKENKKDTREVNDFSEPKPICAGLGIGYQVAIIPKKLLASVMLGVDASQDADNKLIIFPYLNPVLGYVF
ncbi:MAG: hypothetical protein SNJ77_02350 [Cytophagales bacterium]